MVSPRLLNTRSAPCKTGISPTAGGFAAHAKAHRTRLVATLVSKFTRIPADNIPLVVDFWAHVGFY